MKKIQTKAENRLRQLIAFYGVIQEVRESGDVERLGHLCIYVGGERSEPTIFLSLGKCGEVFYIIFYGGKVTIHRQGQTTKKTWKDYSPPW